MFKMASEIGAVLQASEQESGSGRIDEVKAEKISDSQLLASEHAATNFLSLLGKSFPEIDDGAGLLSQDFT
jgi:hypothetical protein